MKFTPVSFSVTAGTAVMLGLLFGLPTITSADDYAGPTMQYDGHYYALIDAGAMVTWQEAKDAAENLTYTVVEGDGSVRELEGHLATVTPAEYSTVIQLHNGYAKAWVGAQFDHAMGEWKWITGETLAMDDPNWPPVSWLEQDDPFTDPLQDVVLLDYANRNPAWEGWWSWHNTLTQQYYIVEFEPPVLVCIGFEPPMDSDAVKVRKKRALPLKAQLFNVDGMPVTDVDIAMPPVLQIMHNPATGGDSIDVTDNALAVGLGTEGNQFEFNVDKWQYNLKTDNYTAPGTYTMNMTTGDSYVIDPTCQASFVVE